MRFAANLISRGALSSEDVFGGTLRFVLVGLFSTGAYFIIALALNQLGLTAGAASTLSLIACWTISYVLQSRFTFKIRRKSNRREIARFMILSIGGICISQTSIEIFHNHLLYPTWVANLVVCVSIPIFNFLVMNFWIFNGDRNP